MELALSKKKWTLSDVECEVMRLDPSVKVDDPAFGTAVVVLAAAVVGPNIKRIASFTGYGRPFVAEKARRLRKQKVWVGGKLDVDWFKPKGEGVVAFWLDVVLADGLLVRQSNAK